MPASGAARKGGGGKQDAAKTAPAKTDAAKTGATKRDAAKTAPAKTDAAKQRGGGVRRGSLKPLQKLLGELPAELGKQVFSHSSWTERRSESYHRLAFLGDSVLGLAVTTHLYPRLEAERFGAGGLTKIRAQVVSGQSCMEVAERLGVLERLEDAAPDERGRAAVREIATQRVLASVLEAVIGACYLNTGYERTAEAVVRAFVPEIEQALHNPVDRKSALQELLARRGDRVKYKLVASEGPAHRRTFEVAALVNGETLGKGAGHSKKAAEQVAAAEALERLGADAGSQTGLETDAEMAVNEGAGARSGAATEAGSGAGTGARSETGEEAGAEMNAGEGPEDL